MSGTVNYFYRADNIIKTENNYSISRYLDVKSYALYYSLSHALFVKYIPED